MDAKTLRSFRLSFRAAADATVSSVFRSITLSFEPSGIHRTLDMLVALGTEHANALGLGYADCSSSALRLRDASRHIRSLTVGTLVLRQRDRPVVRRWGLLNQEYWISSLLLYPEHMHTKMHADEYLAALRKSEVILPKFLGPAIRSMKALRSVRYEHCR